MRWLCCVCGEGRVAHICLAWDQDRSIVLAVDLGAFGPAIFEDNLSCAHQLVVEPRLCKIFYALSMDQKAILSRPVHDSGPCVSARLES